MRITLGPVLLASALLLAACAPPPPVVRPGGTSFDDPVRAAERRDAQLTGASPLTPIGTTDPFGGPSEAERIASDTRNVLGAPPTPGSVLPSGGGVAPLDRDNPEISREQDFASVSAERDIAADAERLRAARAQRQVVAPTALERPEDAGPNVFEYALNEARPVGTAGVYRRGLTASARRAARACREHRGADAAQEAFLAAGGPERDRLGLDPDGDGNACAWDPARVRTLVGERGER